MADDAPAKRVRYFDHQFLTEKDFNDEQEYFLERYRRHHRGLHLHGIVEGLTVTLEGGRLWVEPGTAIDPDGRELVLQVRTPVDAGDRAGDYYVGLGPWQPKAVELEIRGERNKARWDDTPAVVLDSDEVPIPLATVHVEDGGFRNLDPGVRVYSGIALPAEGGPAALRYSPTDGAFHLDNGSPGGVKLRVGKLAVDGGVGIGTASVEESLKLHVHSGRLRVSESDGTGESGVLELSNGSKTNYVFTAASGNLHLRTDSDSHHVVLQDVRGNVGVKAGSPKSPLSVKGGVTIGDTWAESHAAPASGLLVEGNVGIGVFNSNSKLAVTGDVTIYGGSLITNGENQGVIVDDKGRNRIGLMKYEGKEAGIWRVKDQDFEIGTVDVGQLPGTPAKWTTHLYVAGDGNVGIGTMGTSDGKLNVNGKIKAESLQIGDWEITASGTRLIFTAAGENQVEFDTSGTSLYTRTGSWR